MPRYSALVLTFVLVPAVCAIPVDEISARTSVGSVTASLGSQPGGGSLSATANSCTDTLMSCAVSETSSESLLEMWSGNARNGSSALSGASSGGTLLDPIGDSNSTSKVPQGSGFSGVDDEAPGGSVVNTHPALIKLESDDAGKGGNTSSRNSSGLANWTAVSNRGA